MAEARELAAVLLDAVFLDAVLGGGGRSSGGNAASNEGHGGAERAVRARGDPEEEGSVSLLVAHGSRQPPPALLSLPPAQRSKSRTREAQSSGGHWQ